MGIRIQHRVSRGPRALEAQQASGRVNDDLVVSRRGSVEWGKIYSNKAEFREAGQYQHRSGQSLPRSEPK